MFQTLRKMIVPIIGIVLVFFIAMIVLEWGLGFTGSQKNLDRNLAAVINGEDVPWQMYNQIFDNLLKTEAQNTPNGDVSDERRMQLHQKAWQQLVHDRVLLQEVGKRDIKVTPDEIYSYLKYSPPPELQAVPNFQTDGKFDYQKYMSAMADPQASPFWASIEPFIQSDIMKLKLQESVIQAAVVSEEEVKQSYLDANETVKVGVINVGFERFSRPTPETPDSEMHAYFDAHPNDYHLDERRTLNVALLEKEPKPYDWEVSFNKAKQIYDSIKAGADFAEMAKTYSQDASSKQGGDLGWFNEGQMVPEFDKMVFGMRPNDISEPVKTKFGWHIIKLHERKEEKGTASGKTEPEMLKKAHASHILIKADLSQETKDELYNRIEKFRAAALKSGFVKAAEDQKMPLKMTQPFFRNRNIQYIGNNPAVSDFTFDHEMNSISDLMENNSAYFVVQVSQIIPAGPASYDDAHEKVQMDLLKFKVTTMCRDTANAIWADIQAGTPIEKAAKKHGAEYTVVDPFKRDDFVKELRRDPQAIGAAFSMKQPGELKGPTEHSQGVVILKLLERTTPDLTDFNTKRDSVYNDLMMHKQQDLYTHWFDKLVKNSKIVNNVEKALQENPDMM